ncbi:MAG: PaaI family thioesterase [Selenomonadaceae bacterium]
MIDKNMYKKVEQYIMSFYEDNPFVQLLHINIDKIASGNVQLSMKVLHEHTNVYKIAHGGALMSIADTAMGAACLSCKKRVVTLDFSMNFLKAVPENATAYANASIIHDGSSTMVGECDLTDKSGEIFGKAHGTFFVLEKFDK